MWTCWCCSPVGVREHVVLWAPSHLELGWVVPGQRCRAQLKAVPCLTRPWVCQGWGTAWLQQHITNTCPIPMYKRIYLGVFEVEGWNWAKQNLQWCKGLLRDEGKPCQVDWWMLRWEQAERKYFSCRQEERGVLWDSQGDSKSVCFHVLFCNWPKHTQRILTGLCWANALAEVKWRGTSEFALLENVHGWNCKEHKKFPPKCSFCCTSSLQGTCVISNCFQ